MAITRTDPPSLRQKQIDRFWSRVDRSNPYGCWEWTGQRIKWGYGNFKTKPPQTGRTHMAHRLAYFLTTGDWPPLVIHECDNPPCCNPLHLRSAQTHKENAEDKVRKGRQGNTGDDHWTHKNPEKLRFGKDNPSYGQGWKWAGDRNPSRKYPERLIRGDNHRWRKRPELVPRGSSHPTSKLTEDQVLEIRARYVPYRVTEQQLATDFGVTPSLIHQILARKIWKHV